MKEIVAGDLHRNWNILNNLIKQEKPDIILQCGDFGFFNNSKELKKCIKNDSTKIYFADGNHDQFNKLLTLKNNEIVYEN